MPTQRVKEIMLALEEYAVVDQDASLAEALAALEQAQARLPAGRQPHRAVLVQDRDGVIVGSVGHLEFMQGLLPGARGLRQSEMLERAGVTDAMREQSVEMFEFLGDALQVDLPARARHVQVADFCRSRTFHIDEGVSLLEAVRAFEDHRVLSLLVRRGEETVGVLRLADLFDELARVVLGKKDGQN